MLECKQCTHDVSYLPQVELYSLIIANGGSTHHLTPLDIPYGWNEMQYPNLGNFFCNEAIELELRSFYATQFSFSTMLHKNNKGPSTYLHC